jgi:hypothetical protein
MPFTLTLHTRTNPDDLVPLQGHPSKTEIRKGNQRVLYRMTAPYHWCCGEESIAFAGGLNGLNP